MAGGHEFAPDLEALANEELSGAVLRQILARLSSAEFGGSDQPTVSAVCEATGATLMTVGRMLADIRRADLQKSVGDKLGKHEIALQELRVKIRRIELVLASLGTQEDTVVVKAKPIPRTPEERRADYFALLRAEEADRQRVREKFRGTSLPVIAVFLVLALILALAILPSMNAGNPLK